MKRIQDYYDEIIAVKNANSDLDELKPYNDNGAQLMDDLNSESKVALWRLWIWISATLAWMQNLSLIKHKQEIENQIINNRHGTIPFYVHKSLNFQFGHALEWNGNHFEYANEEPQTKIISRCSVKMLQGILQFKVAKETLAGELIPLVVAEKLAFNDYLNDVLYPGTNYSVISEIPDLLKLILKIYINSQVIDSNGIDLITGEKEVENAINLFCQNLPFDGNMNLQKLVDKIQDVKGVEDIEVLESSYKYGLLSWIVFTRQITPFSGHMSLDVVNSNITYHEYV